MTDLSGISDDALLKMYQPRQGAPSATSPGLTEMSDEDLIKTYQATKAAPTAPIKADVGLGEDIAKAAGSGLVQGVESVVGLPGDLQHAVGWGAGKVAGIFGASEDRQAEVAKGVQSGIPLIGRLPNSDDVASAVKNVTGFEPYEPQTRAGKVVRTAAEFVPGAIVMGPGGIVKGAASNAVKFGVVPGIASEAAGQATEGTGLEPFARGGAALVAGGGMAVRDAVKARSAAIEATPTRQALKDQSQALYTASEAEGLVVKPSAFNGAVDDIAKDVKSAGLDKDIHPKATAALRRLEEAKGTAPTLKEIDTVRQVLGEAAKSVEPAERMMAGKMIDKLDDFVEKLNAGHVIYGDATKAVGLLQEARSLWKMQAKSGIIDDLMERASTKAAMYSGSGMENAIRSEFRALALNPKKMRRFEPAERRAINYVAKGGPMENAARMLGKFAGRGVVSTTLSGGAGFAAAGPLGAAGMLAAGEAGRQAATAMTKDSAARVSAMVRSGGKMPAGLEKSLPGAVGSPVLRALITEAASSRGGG